MQNENGEDDAMRLSYTILSVREERSDANKIDKPCSDRAELGCATE